MPRPRIIDESPPGNGHAYEHTSLSENHEGSSVPISIDEFESHDPEEGETAAERVVRFLARNRYKAYEAVEIAEATGVDENRSIRC